MSVILHQLLILFAVVCFAFSGWQSASPYWNRIVSIGFVCLALSFLSYTL